MCTGAVALLGLVAGCASSETSSSDYSGPATIPAALTTVAVATTTTAPSNQDSLPAASTTVTTEPTVDPVGNDLSLQGVASVLTAAELGCTDMTEKPTGDDTSITLLPPPETTEGTCTLVGGRTITVSVAADADQVRIATAQLEVYGPMMVAFGVLEVAYVVAGPDDRVWVSFESVDGTTVPKPTEADMAGLELLAEVLNGEVRTFTP